MLATDAPLSIARVTMVRVPWRWPRAERRSARKPWNSSVIRSDVAAAIDFERGAGDVFGLVQAAPWDRADEAAATFGFVRTLFDTDEARQHRRVGRDGIDRDDPNSKRRQLDRQGLGHRDYRAFGRGIHGQAWPGADPGRAGRVQDHPATLGLHLRDRRPTAEEHALDVDVEDAVEQLISRVFEGGKRLRQTGVVVEHVEAAELVHGRLDHLLYLGTLSYVNLHGFGLAARAEDLVGRFGRARRIQISGNDGRAFARKLDRRCAADARTGTSDHCHQTLELAHART